MKNLNALSWGRWACLLTVVGCGQGQAEDGTPPADVDVQSDEASRVEGVEGVRRVASSDGVDGETFSQIWGANDDLWAISRPVPPAPSSEQAQEGVPLILRCPIVWDASAVVRRNTGDGWQDMHVPATTSVTSLHGSDASNVWAVGLGGAAVQFDGSGWIEHDVRSATGLEFQEQEDQCAALSLHSVFARSPSDVWAVGFIFPSTLGPGLILHYDGAKWERHATSAGDGFFSVWAASASDAWAVGSSGISYHFDGTSWEPVDAKTTQYLFSVWGTSASDVWATGNMAVTTRFDGNQWELLQTEKDYRASDSLTGNAAAGLWSLSTTSVAGALGSQALLEWADGRWQERASFTEASDRLSDLWVTPEGDLWGAGAQVVRFR